jgi:hypothetical protein
MSGNCQAQKSLIRIIGLDVYVLAVGVENGLFQDDSPDFRGLSRLQLLLRASGLGASAGLTYADYPESLIAFVPYYVYRLSTAA